MTLKLGNASFNIEGTEVTFQLQGETAGKAVSVDKELEHAMDVFQIKSKVSKCGFKRLVAYVDHRPKYPFLYEMEGRRTRRRSRVLGSFSQDRRRPMNKPLIQVRRSEIENLGLRGRR